MKKLTGLLLIVILLSSCEKCVECRNQWNYNEVYTECGSSDELEKFENDVTKNNSTSNDWYRCTPVKK